MTAIARLFTAKVVFLIATQSAAGATVYLSQLGWHPGGSLDVRFSGTDADANGSIDMQELTTFQAMFMLPQGGATSWSEADIEPGGFVFQSTADFLLILSNDLYSLTDNAFNGETLGAVFDAFLFPVATTTEEASLVPEPHSIALTGSTLVCAVLELIRRRRLRRRGTSGDLYRARSVLKH
jgi:hypothetical protein